MSTEPSKQHLDAFMTISVSLDFHAKLNLESKDPIPSEFSGCGVIMPPDGAADYVEEVIKASRDTTLRTASIFATKRY